MIYQSKELPANLIAPPTKAMDYCHNYSSQFIANALSNYDITNFVISQQSHAESGTDDDSVNSLQNDTENMKGDVHDLQQRKISFEERHNSVLTQNSRAYSTLKSDFSQLCKFIDGDKDQINIWKWKFKEAFAEATEK
eukprot:15360774-Ditylum_brightwellii.AAC.1